MPQEPEVRISLSQEGAIQFIEGRVVRRLCMIFLSIITVVGGSALGLLSWYCSSQIEGRMVQVDDKIDEKLSAKVETQMAKSLVFTAELQDALSQRAEIAVREYGRQALTDEINKIVGDFVTTAVTPRVEGWVQDYINSQPGRTRINEIVRESFKKSGEQVKVLLQTIRSEDEDEQYRLLALQMYLLSGENADERRNTLLWVIGQGTSMMRKEALRFYRPGDEFTSEDLLPVMKSLEDNEVDRECVNAYAECFSRFGQGAVKELGERAVSESIIGTNKINAITGGLSLLGGEGAARCLLDLANHNDPDVRDEAFSALERFGIDKKDAALQPKQRQSIAKAIYDQIKKEVTTSGGGISGDLEFRTVVRETSSRYILRDREGRLSPGPSLSEQILRIGDRVPVYGRRTRRRIGVSALHHFLRPSDWDWLDANCWPEADETTQSQTLADTLLATWIAVLEESDRAPDDERAMCDGLMDRAISVQRYIDRRGCRTALGWALQGCSISKVDVFFEDLATALDTEGSLEGEYGRLPIVSSRRIPSPLSAAIKRDKEKTNGEPAREPYRGLLRFLSGWENIQWKNDDAKWRWAQTVARALETEGLGEEKVLQFLYGLLLSTVEVSRSRQLVAEAALNALRNVPSIAMEASMQKIIDSARSLRGIDVTDKLGKKQPLHGHMIKMEQVLSYYCKRDPTTCIPPIRQAVEQMQKEVLDKTRDSEDFSEARFHFLNVLINSRDIESGLLCMQELSTGWSPSDRQSAKKNLYRLFDLLKKTGMDAGELPTKISDDELEDEDKRNEFQKKWKEWWEAHEDTLGEIEIPLK